MVWMEMPSFNNFSKLWGRINNKLYKGNYVLTVKSQFDVEKYNAKKSFVIKTSSIIGTKLIYSIFLLGAAGVLIVLSLFLIIFKKSH